MDEQIEQPGKNAIEHACQMQVEIPGEDGEESTFKRYAEGQIKSTY